MNVRGHTPLLQKIGKLTSAVILGLGLGTLLSTDLVTVPAVGTVPWLVASLVLLGGGGLFVGLDRLDPSTGSGCGGDCGFS